MFPGLFLLLLASLALFWLLLSIHTVWMLTHPPRRAYAWAVSRSVPGDPAELGLAFSEWTFRSRSRDLPVWDIRAANPSGPLIIITHGWGDSRVVHLSRAAGLAPHASRIILWDLPGHGDAPGICELGSREHADLLTLLDHLNTPPPARTPRATDPGSGGAGPVPLTSARPTPHPPLILYGSSLGAGISMAAALQSAHPIAAVIAEAPYRIPPTPARNVLRLRALPFRTNLAPAMTFLGLSFGQGISWGVCTITHNPGHSPRFDRAKLARQLRCPLLVLHGECDPVSPPDDGRAIAASCPSGRIAIIPAASHNNLWIDPAFADQSAAAVRDFLASLSSLHSAPAPAPASP